MSLLDALQSTINWLTHNNSIPMNNATMGKLHHDYTSIAITCQYVCSDKTHTEYNSILLHVTY